ncbi:MAG: hypothetical protein OEZ13_06750 [Spirochaetia bacterium]|nr:hypothetical protein [Spirochaetia bacterium]
MKKTITIKEFSEELKVRIEKDQTIDCCKDEILKLAEVAADKIGSQEIEVTWQEA